ncbi:MAG: serine/threonine-protein kinase [Reyranellaceae bacterium]
MTDDAPTAKQTVDRTEHHAALMPGVMIGRYRIESVLGLGGFGITYRCYDTHLRRDVAVKEYLPTGIAIRHESATVLPRSTEMSTDFVWGRNRFLDEARTIAKLGHVPAVVRVHDFLEAHGTAYVVMELLSGETMSQRLKREPRLSQATIDRILPSLLDGLEQIHTAGFLHRDIKPANIILGPGDAATLIDFGASRVAIADRSQALTAVFTPGYAAPEQSTSGKQGPWTDVYGLAATLFTAVTGKVPPSVMERVFEGATVFAAEASVNGHSPNLLAGIDAGLRLPIEARPQSIAAWRQMLFSEQAAPADAIPTAALPFAPKAVASRPATSNRSRYGMLAGAAVVALAVGYSLFALTARDDRTAAGPAPSSAPSVAAANGSTANSPAATPAPAPAQVATPAPPRDLIPAATSAAPAPQPPASAPSAAAPDSPAPAVPPTLPAATASPAPVAPPPLPPATTPAPVAVVPPAPPPLPIATPALTPDIPPPLPPLPTATPAPTAIAPPAGTPASTQAAQPPPVQSAAPATAPAPAHQTLDEMKALDADSRAIEESRSRRDRSTQEAVRPEEPKKTEEQLKAEAEQAETALKLGTRDRQKIQIALTSLGFDAGGADGVFGPRTRTKIAEWQSANGEPPTGFISADNKTTLFAKAAPAIARWEEAQRRAYLEEQRRLEELRKTPPPPPPQPTRTWRWPWEDRRIFP